MSASLHRAAITVLALLTMGAIAFGQHYTQTNLVANTSGVAPVTDPDLVNAWGLARSSSSPWWIANQKTGTSTVYTGAGTKIPLIVAIPPAVSGHPGLPTGIIFNGNATSFLLPGGPAHFLFCTLDGLILGWDGGTTAMVVVKTTNHSSYTGLTSAMVNGNAYLYAANFNTGHVDVYDSSFHPVSLDNEHSAAAFADEMGDDQDDEYDSERAFTDRQLPDNYDPFNVQAIGNDIVVTYALHMPGSMFETDGPGLGRVDIYSKTGRLLKRLQHGDWLNAPWGVALAPLDFGAFSHMLLVGQFAGGGTTQSSGYIAAYDMTTGRFEGLMLDTSGNPLAINGVWAISFGNSSPNNYDAAGAPAAEMYFTSGPNHGSGGLFGFVTPIATEMVEGNDQ